MKELILASQSPRRRELLAKCTERFTVEAADIEETMDPQKPLPELPVKKVDLPEGVDLLTGEKAGGETELPTYGIRVLKL